MLPQFHKKIFANLMYQYPTAMTSNLIIMEASYETYAIITTVSITSNIFPEKSRFPDQR